MRRTTPAPWKPRLPRLAPCSPKPGAQTRGRRGRRLRILTDRGTEYCGRPEQYDYQLYLAVNDIEHSKTKAKSPQTNGICERFHRTILQEFYQVAFRKAVFENIDQLQKELDTWIDFYNPVS